MKYVIPTTNLDSIVASMLLCHYKGYQLRKYWYKNFKEDTFNIMIRAFGNHTEVNDKSKRCENPISFVDCQDTQVDPSKLEKEVSYFKYESTSVSKAILDTLKDANASTRLLVALIDDYTTYSLKLKDSIALSRVLESVDVHTPEGYAYYIELLSGSEIALERSIAEGYEILNFMKPIEEIFNKELTVKDPSDLFYHSNGCLCKSFLPDDLPCKISWSRNWRGICATVFATPDCTQEVKTKVINLLTSPLEAPSSIEGGNVFCIFNVDPSLLSSSFEPVSDVDYSQLVIQNDTIKSLSVKGYLCSLIERHNAMVTDQGVMYLNTQYVYDDLIRFKLSLPGIEKLVLYVRRKDGMFRHCTYSKDTFTACSPSDIKISETISGFQ